MWESSIFCPRLDGGGRRNRTPILSERRFSGPVANHQPAPSALERRPRLELGKIGFAIRRLDRFGMQRLAQVIWQGTRDSNSAITGLESAALPIEPVPRGGPAGIRTQKSNRFWGGPCASSGMPQAHNGARPGSRTRKTLRSERSDFTNLPSRAWSRERDLNPHAFARRSQRRLSARFQHPEMVCRAGLEPAKPEGGAFTAHWFSRSRHRHKRFNFQRSGGESGNRTRTSWEGLTV